MWKTHKHTLTHTHTYTHPLHTKYKNYQKNNFLTSLSINPYIPEQNTKYSLCANKGII